MEARSSVSELKADEKVHLYIAKRIEEGTPAVPQNEDLCMMKCEADGMLVFEDEGEHLYPENLIDLYAFYQEGFTTRQEDLTEVTVSVQTDQSAAGAEEESDFLYAEAKEGFGNSTEPITLKFDHQFARLRFTFKTNTPNQVDLSGLSGVEIQGVVTNGTFNVQTGAFTLGSTKETVKAWLTGNSNGEATAIIVPQTLGEGATFCFTVGGEELIYEVPADEREFVAGTQYNYTVTLDKYAELPQQQVQVECTVGDWGKMEEREITVAKGETVNMKLSDVVEGVTIVKADLYFGGGIVQKEVAVADGKMEIVYPLLAVGQKVTLEWARFYTDKGEAFNYYFTEKELNGNGTDELALTPPTVGASWGEGVVFITGEIISYNQETGEFVVNQVGVNAYHGRIIADDEILGIAWTSSNAVKGHNEVIGMLDDADGINNLNTLKEFITRENEDVEDYPLYKEITTYGDGGWYVPAFGEMVYILQHQAELNKTLETRGGTLFGHNKNGYFTSTERPKSDKEENTPEDMCSTQNNTSYTLKSVPADKFTIGIKNVRPVKAF